jgi:AraC-like DNA-binding protein
LLLLISLHWLFVTSRAVLSVLNVKQGDLLSLIDLYSILIFLAFTTLLVLRGLKQLKIFSGVEEKSKYVTSNLTDTNIQKYAQKLTRYMKTYKPYLNESLSLEDLSKKLSISSWKLSQVINKYFNQNFYSYVNQYRIEEAKLLLLDRSNGRRTILEILYEVGFSSKSVFNLAFKKYTGMTPKEFKNAYHTEHPPIKRSIKKSGFIEQVDRTFLAK